jgi:hypothetical protein
MSAVQVLHLPGLIAMIGFTVDREFFVLDGGTIFKTHGRSGRRVRGPYMSWIVPAAVATIFLSLPSMLLRMVVVCTYWIAMALWLDSIRNSLVVVRL